VNGEDGGETCRGELLVVFVRAEGDGGGTCREEPLVVLVRAGEDGGRDEREGLGEVVGLDERAKGLEEEVGLGGGAAGLPMMEPFGSCAAVRHDARLARAIVYAMIASARGTLSCMIRTS